MVRAIWTSNDIKIEVKEKFLQSLLSRDDSDKFHLTKRYCKAAQPSIDAKMTAWKDLLSKFSKALNVYDVEAITAGFRQIN